MVANALGLHIELRGVKRCFYPHRGYHQVKFTVTEGSSALPSSAHVPYYGHLHIHRTSSELQLNCQASGSYLEHPVFVRSRQPWYREPVGSGEIEALSRASMLMESLDEILNGPTEVVQTQA